MLPNHPRHFFSGEFTPDFANDLLVHDAISQFLNKRLPEWASDSKYHNPKTLEDDLTDWLSNFLNTHAENDLPPIAFTNQQRQTKGRGVDMGIRPRPISGITIGNRAIHRDEPISTIEAKRLPTPDSRRRREYVIGDRIKNGTRARSGGIERYKENDHAEGLPHAYMFGYIQAKPRDGNWLATINSWISEVAALPPKGTRAIWDTLDHLSAAPDKDRPRLTEFTSRHLRNDDSQIELKHFWINLIADTRQN